VTTPRRDRPLRILIDPGCYNLRNMGGVAMMQVAIGRTRAHWPDAEVSVFTDDPALLQRHFPGVKPVPHQDLRRWLSDHYLLGPMHRLAPAMVSHRLLDLQQGLRSSRPGWMHAATLLKMRLAREDRRDYGEFVAQISGADVVIVSGAGGINDDFGGYVRGMATLLESAVARRAPAALFGQGVGPLTDPVLRRRLGRTLPRVDLIGVRESRRGPALLRDLGVPASRIAETGDDAIELALAAPIRERAGLGVNLRLAAYTGLDESTAAAIRPVVQAFARARGAPVHPVPIGLHTHAADDQAIRLLLAGFDDASDGGAGLDTPQQVIDQVARCRVVLTGAYHAAVFALAQGIPVVGLADSELYVDKFAGLADAFGTGCTIVSAGGPDLVGRLTAALRAAWDTAPDQHAPLRAAAGAQAGRSRAAYAQFFERAARARATRPRRRPVEVS
jgi:colanic acid/amylovoran biosynthesis protein